MRQKSFSVHGITAILELIHLHEVVSEYAKSILAF